ncbi:putative pectinesterase 63 [Euphorbia lathyris]|uniref:putative pectinesterase 63 n=1 Tax=Euphorbia lathyris TaxID=212925 RepID=UPI0033139CF2
MQEKPENLVNRRTSEPSLKISTWQGSSFFLLIKTYNIHPQNNIITKMTCIISSIQYAILFILVIAITVNSDDASPIPTEKTKVSKWFLGNIKPYQERKNTLDPLLYKAEASRRTIKVRKDGKGDFKTVMEAIESIPSGNKQRVIVNIGDGVFNEKIIINRTKPFVTLYGAGKFTTLQFDGTAKQYGTINSASVAVESDYFVASNLIIKNTAPRPNSKTRGAQAVALRISGDKAAIYKCNILGFQDTLCDDKGRHFFYGCYIEGTMDFIFGSGKSLYLRTRIHALHDETGVTIITAQARNSKLDDSGYSFVHCQVTGDKTGNTYLGRLWIKLPQVVFAYTTMTDVIVPEAWLNEDHPEKNGDILFGEYKNSGRGATLAGRAKHSKQLDDKQARYFLSLGYIQASKWLLPPPASRII